MQSRGQCDKLVTAGGDGDRHVWITPVRTTGVLVQFAWACWHVCVYGREIAVHSCDGVVARRPVCFEGLWLVTVPEEVLSVFATLPAMSFTYLLFCGLSGYDWFYGLSKITFIKSNCGGDLPLW